MDEEKLILLVSGYRELYDLSDKNYSNQERKNNCWKEIAEYLDQPVSECKEKWSRIRDNFRKALRFRKNKSGDAATKIKPYKYEKELSFLKPFLTDRCQKSNLSTPNSPESHDEVSNDHEESDDFVESEPPTPASTNSTIGSGTPKVYSHRAKKRIQPQVAPQNSVANVLEKYLQSQSQSQSTGNTINTEVNSMKQFFIAMADSVQSFPRVLQLDVKSKVFNIVQEAEMKCLQEKENVQVQNIQYGIQTGIQNEDGSWENSVQGQTHHMQPSRYPNTTFSNYPHYDVNQ